MELFMGLLSSCLILFCFRDQNKVILRTFQIIRIQLLTLIMVKFKEIIEIMKKNILIFTNLNVRL